MGTRGKKRKREEVRHKQSESEKREKQRNWGRKGKEERRREGKKVAEGG